MGSKKIKLNRILEVGMQGDDVKYLQEKLKEKGYFKFNCDGYFSQNLLISVTNFQRSININKNGTVGSQTWSNL